MNITIFMTFNPLFYRYFDKIRTITPIHSVKVALLIDVQAKRAYSINDE